MALSTGRLRRPKKVSHFVFLCIPSFEMASDKKSGKKRARSSSPIASSEVEADTEPPAPSQKNNERKKKARVSSPERIRGTVSRAFSKATGRGLDEVEALISKAKISSARVETNAGLRKASKGKASTSKKRAAGAGGSKGKAGGRSSSLSVSNTACYGDSH